MTPARRKEDFTGAAHSQDRHAARILHKNPCRHVFYQRATSKQQRFIINPSQAGKLSRTRVELRQTEGVCKIYAARSEIPLALQGFGGETSSTALVTIVRTIHVVADAPSAPDQAGDLVCLDRSISQVGIVCGTHRIEQFKHGTRQRDLVRGRVVRIQKIGITYQCNETPTMAVQVIA